MNVRWCIIPITNTEVYNYIVHSRVMSVWCVPAMVSEWLHQEQLLVACLLLCVSIVLTGSTLMC